MKNILVTIDFDEGLELIVDKALELAQAFGSKVWLMHIAAPNPSFVGYEAGPQCTRDSRAKKLREEHRVIQSYTTKLRHKGIHAEGLLIQGATIETIMLESKKLNIDLIIAGHHEQGFLYNAFIGSVSAQIIKKSKIPVLIIPFD